MDLLLSYAKVRLGQIQQIRIRALAVCGLQPGSCHIRRNLQNTATTPVQYQIGAINNQRGIEMGRRYRHGGDRTGHSAGCVANHHIISGAVVRRPYQRRHVGVAGRSAVGGRDDVR
jgi:hypothetical protein